MNGKLCLWLILFAVKDLGNRETDCIALSRYLYLSTKSWRLGETDEEVSLVLSVNTGWRLVTIFVLSPGERFSSEIQYRRLDGFQNHP